MHPLARTTGLALVVALLGALGAAPATAQLTNSPAGDLGVLSADLQQFVAPGETQTYALTLGEGRRGRILLLTATIQWNSLGQTTLLAGISATVNGVDLVGGLAGPFGPGGGPEVSNLYTILGVDRGTTTLTWWLDLNEAEAANPGAIIRQPLDVELAIQNVTAGTSPTADLDLEAVTMIGRLGRP